MYGFPIQTSSPWCLLFLWQLQSFCHYDFTTEFGCAAFYSLHYYYIFVCLFFGLVDFFLLLLQIRYSHFIMRHKLFISSCWHGWPHHIHPVKALNRDRGSGHVNWLIKKKLFNELIDTDPLFGGNMQTEQCDCYEVAVYAVAFSYLEQSWSTTEYYSWTYQFPWYMHVCAYVICY